MNGMSNFRRMSGAGLVLALIALCGLSVSSLHARQPAASETPTCSGLRAEGFTRQSQTATDEKPYVIEYYYKAKWGHADEFLALFKKNHYPLLRKEMELGRILKVSMTAPRYHTTEDGRWDFRVSIVFKNAAVANDDFDSALLRQLFPDQQAYQKEEQRRFEILDAHWDLPIKAVDLDSR
jgi:hypothetical protein